MPWIFASFLGSPCSLSAMNSIHPNIRWHAEEQSQNHAITHGTAPEARILKEDPILVSYKSWRTKEASQKKGFWVLTPFLAGFFGISRDFTFGSYDWGVEWGKAPVCRIYTLDSWFLICHSRRLTGCLTLNFAAFICTLWCHLLVCSLILLMPKTAVWTKDFPIDPIIDNKEQLGPLGLGVE